jgi:hypothetical protein
MREVPVLGLTALAGLSAALVVAPNPARANCHETFGCTNSQYFDPSQPKQASCQVLWETRNWIYKENGYCFHTSEAIKVFDNTGCVRDDVAAVPLNGFERANVEAIKQTENSKGCP